MSHYGDIEVYFQVLLFIYILRFFQQSVCASRFRELFLYYIYIFNYIMCNTASGL